MGKEIMLTFGSLFSGIGGIDLGLERAISCPQCGGAGENGGDRRMSVLFPIIVWLCLLAGVAAFIREMKMLDKKAVKPIRIFMGDDKKFIIAEDRYVVKEHVERWEGKGWYRVRLVTRKRPTTFYLSEDVIHTIREPSNYYWDVHAWVELASEFEKSDLSRKSRGKISSPKRLSK